MKAYTVMDGKKGSTLGEQQSNVVNIADDVVDVTLMKWRFNQVEQSPHKAAAPKPTSPFLCDYVRRQSPADCVEYPLQTEFRARLLALIVLHADLRR
jgi:hypothetical protein